VLFRSDLISVDDNDKIAGLLGRSVGGLILAPEHISDFGGDAPEGLPLRVDHVSRALSGLGRDEYGLHVSIPSPSLGFVRTARGRYNPIKRK
jgi:hypothetical protein